MVIVESLKYVSISVADIEKSFKFYKNLFDLDVIERPDESKKEAILQVGEFKLRIAEAEDVSQASNSESFICFTIEEADFEDTVDEIKGSGLDIVNDPDESDRDDVIIFKDPDGNQIALSC